MKGNTMAEIFYHKAIDMTLLDYLAAHAPEPDKSDVDLQRMHDNDRAYTDKSFIRRDDLQIKCELRYKYAKEMLKVRRA
jgi:hypothetical protein